jgi:hypothetical protein
LSSIFIIFGWMVVWQRFLYLFSRKCHHEGHSLRTDSVKLIHRNIPHNSSSLLLKRLLVYLWTDIALYICVISGLCLLPVKPYFMKRTRFWLNFRDACPLLCENIFMQSQKTRGISNLHVYQKPKWFRRTNSWLYCYGFVMKITRLLRPVSRS